jgi:hypothetical protein
MGRLRGSWVAGATVAVAVLAASPAPAGAASSTDVAATHAYVEAANVALSAVVKTWPKVEASVRKLDARFQAECPHVGAGSPQSEEEQKLAHEVAGALWATGYHTDAAIERRFVRAIGRLHWSNPTVDRYARGLVTSLNAMVALQIPNVCADVRSWAADGYNAVPASTAAYASHVDSIEIKEIPRNLLVAYARPGDKGLIARTERLATRFEELEFMTGQTDWNNLLELLSLNQ